MTTKTTPKSSASSAASASPALVKARVMVRPRDPADLKRSFDDATSLLRARFGACCVDVGAVGVGDGAWLATVVLDAARAEHNALLLSHKDDERLWRSFVAAACVDGACDVVSIELRHER